MSEHPYLSDDNQSRKENALKAAMPYILFERPDVFMVPRDEKAVDFNGAIKDALRSVWQSFQAMLYPMPKEVDADVPAECEDRPTQ